MSNKKCMTVGDVIGLFSHPTRVDIMISDATTLITVEMDKERNAGRYLSNDILNAEIEIIYAEEEDYIIIQIKDDGFKECL